MSGAVQPQGAGIAALPLHNRARQLGVLLMAAALVFILLPTLAAGAEDGDAPVDRITITTPESPQNSLLCADGDQLWKLGSEHGVHQTDEYWEFWIKVHTSPCEPQEYYGAIYAMPDNQSDPWPQTLVEAKPFTVQSMGTYTIRIDKTCANEQFDVLSAPVPDVANKLLSGPTHGLLIFPLDFDGEGAAAYQHWGGGCEPQVAPTTLPNVVDDENTAVPPPAPQVEPASVTPAQPQIVQGNRAELPRTGAATLTMTLIGGSLLAAGAVLVLQSRRRLSDAS